MIYLYQKASLYRGSGRKVPGNSLAEPPSPHAAYSTKKCFVCFQDDLIICLIKRCLVTFSICGLKHTIQLILNITYHSKNGSF